VRFQPEDIVDGAHVMHVVVIGAGQ
jgi:hypothetical protein